MSEGEWVKAAMSDDTMVVDLLIHLLHHRTTPKPLVLPQWTFRQRRSNHRSTATLSSEESPRPLPSDTKIRSNRVNGDSDKTTSKRARKKTLLELKEEEKLLVKERKELKRVLTAMRMNLDKQRATNESLKRMKIELQPHADTARTSKAAEHVSSEFQENRTSGCVPCTTPQILSTNVVTVQRSDHKFSLPDLNMPFHEAYSDVICGVS